MIKRKELTDPNSCMSRAKDDEMTFVLLARDEAAPFAIRAWTDRRIYLGRTYRRHNPFPALHYECGSSWSLIENFRVAPAPGSHEEGK